MSDYASFLAEKRPVDPATGLRDVPPITPALFPFQADIVRWALRRGRGAIFADCGMGKTPMQLEWARHVPGDVLILTPLAVAAQTVREGQKFGIPASYARNASEITGRITVTNYDRLDAFDPARFAGVVLDESSILKAFDGKTRTALIEAFAQTPFRLACTATPAPNDYMELGNHAEFLGTMTRAEMLAMFFVHDGGETQEWRLKGHAASDFWRWLASWSVMLRRPSDLGYPDDGYTLPPCETVERVVPTGATAGNLFAVPAQTLQERIQARRETVADRVAACAEIVNTTPGSWVVWCNLNAESDALAKAIPDAVEVRGSDDADAKERALAWFQGELCLCQYRKNEKHTIANGMRGIANASEHIARQPKSSGTNVGASFTDPTQNDGSEPSPPCGTTTAGSQTSGSRNGSANTGSRQTTTDASSLNKAADAPYADAPNPLIAQNGPPVVASGDSTLTTATHQGECADSSARPATSASGSSVTIPIESSEPRCTCGHVSGRRILITKSSIAGFGMNWQHCHQMAFVGLSDSWEQYYQAVRRCWRFGQQAPVTVHLITAETEGAVLNNIKRKDADAAAMAEAMVAHTKDLAAAAVHGVERDVAEYERDVASGTDWTLYKGDCVEVVRELASDSIDFSIFSPPFASLYTYSNSERDMGNCADHDTFYRHFGYLVTELYRVTKPGRLVSFHCMNLPTSKVRDGVIGLRDFRGELIRLFESEGWIYHSEVVIWKDPVTAMQRTKALGLLHKTIRTDSSMSRQGIPDYLVTMRKPGENVEPIAHTADEFPVSLWQRYASPVWMDIDPSDTLQYRSAREHEDEKHICPLQLQVIRRALMLWSNPGDLVLSPFAGIGSEGVVALEEGRRFVGVELKGSYWRQARANLTAAKANKNGDLFAGMDAA